MKKKKQSRFAYGIVRFASGFVSRLIFKRKYLRNELKGKKGPIVVIANHECSLDFMNLIGVTREMMTFTISRSYYDTLSNRAIVDKLGMIPKQQFQSSVKDVAKMTGAIKRNKILVIFPAGLMTEDGKSTPVPETTYKFLKFLNSDVYVAKSIGTYFNNPKWGKGLRKGRSYLDVYRLFSKEELAQASDEEAKIKVKEALDFDAYEDQEKYLVKYKKADQVEGLQNVLYKCPNCGEEYSITVLDKHTLGCKKCGYQERADKYGFLHNDKGLGKEYRHVSKWSKFIYDDLKEKIISGIDDCISIDAKIQMIDYGKHEFVDVGEGKITLDSKDFIIDGTIKGENKTITVETTKFASLPFKPGKFFEIQHGDDIYRCFPKENPVIVMKIINMVKIFYELSTEGKKSE